MRENWNSYLCKEPLYLFTSNLFIQLKIVSIVNNCFYSKQSVQVSDEHVCISFEQAINTISTFANFFVIFVRTHFLSDFKNNKCEIIFQDLDICRFFLRIARSLVGSDINPPLFMQLLGRFYLQNGNPSSRAHSQPPLQRTLARCSFSPPNPKWTPTAHENTSQLKFSETHLKCCREILLVLEKMAY